ncbi:hypothetical protein PV458_27130 [Streptomyces sp. MN03-5084-2B]|nr:hypothetical protein [Streptomyces sp. MN03-5084-2B]
MSLFRKRGATNAPTTQLALPAAAEPPQTASPFLNVFGRELSEVLDEELREQIFGGRRDTSHIIAADDGARAFATLDWLVHIWLPRWVSLVPTYGEVHQALIGLPAVRDLETAESAGRVVGALEELPGQAEAVIAKYKDNFFEEAAASAARTAAGEACAESAGSAAVAAASSADLEACMAVRTDIALANAQAIALLTSLDGVVPYIQTWTAGPGDFDAKQISISNLAPHAARRTLESTTEPLRQSALELYKGLSQPRTA